jgi:hypothetical protein
MRAHGVPNFPDPMTLAQVPRDTNVMINGPLAFPLGTSIDPGSPAFVRAGAVCGGPGREGRPKGG